MKQIFFRKIHILLAIIAASICSCSKALLFEDNSNGLNGNTGKLIINGIVTDSDTYSPIEGIQVSFQCSQENFEKITVYTDNDGIYTIVATGFTETITGCVSVRDLDDVYWYASREIKVNWKGEAYDPEKSTFIVNDCNFSLPKQVANE